MLNFEAGDRLRGAANRIAEAALARDYAQRPYLADRYGEYGKMRYRQDVLYNLAALAAALDAHEERMFLDYVAWLKIVLLHRGVGPDDIAESLRCMKLAIEADAPRGEHLLALALLDSAFRQLDAMPDRVVSYLAKPSEEHALARGFLEALLCLDTGAAREIVESALDAGMPLLQVYTEVIPPLMREIGRLWQRNEISVAHEHFCSAAVESIVSGFYRRILGSRQPCERSMMVVCVEGEQHELGARVVADVFELNGWRTSFLGANLPQRDLVTLMKEAQPDLIALSAAMPNHLVKLASTIDAVRDASNIPIIVGGYLFSGSPDLAERLGADGHAADAASALGVADALVGRHV